MNPKTHIQIGPNTWRYRGYETDPPEINHEQRLLVIEKLNKELFPWEILKLRPSIKDGYSLIKQAFTDPVELAYANWWWREM